MVHNNAAPDRPLLSVATVNGSSVMTPESEAAWQAQLHRMEATVRTFYEHRSLTATMVAAAVAAGTSPSRPLDDDNDDGRANDDDEMLLGTAAAVRARTRSRRGGGGGDSCWQRLRHVLLQ